jgi:hypothetical protein
MLHIRFAFLFKGIHTDKNSTPKKGNKNYALKSFWWDGAWTLNRKNIPLLYQKYVSTVNFSTFVS